MNLAVAVTFLAVYLCSLRPGNIYPAGVREETGLAWLADSVNHEFNSAVDSFCDWCVQPDEPVRTAVSRNANGDTLYESLNYYASEADSRMTATILRNTFPLVLFVLFIANFFFRFGRMRGDGTIVRMNAMLRADGRRLKRWFRHRRPAEEEAAPAAGFELAAETES